MSTLFTHVTALLLDEAFTTLKDGYIAVEGSRITHVGSQRPQGEGLRRKGGETPLRETLTFSSDTPE